MWDKALRSVRGGTVLRLETSPGSSSNEWAGYDQWRAAIKVKVSAQAREGRANEALVKFVAETFDIPSSRARILVGGKSRLKELFLEGVSIESVRATLAGVIHS